MGHGRLIKVADESVSAEALKAPGFALEEPLDGPDVCLKCQEPQRPRLVALKGAPMVDG